MPTKLFLHATNVHQGGGRSLLSELMKALPGNARVTLDSRMPIPEGMALEDQISRVRPTILRRLSAEKWLAGNVTPEDVVLCFGNLPPLFKLRGRVVVFVQNRYLIDDVRLTGLPLRASSRLAIERLWLSGRKMNVDEFIVQTPTMKKLLETKIEGKVPVRILPFIADPHEYVHNVLQLTIKDERDFDFVYVASGEPHKNHRRLLEAWVLLAAEGLFPSLCLTLNGARFQTLCQEVEEMSQLHKLKIMNVSELSHDGILALYRKAGASIYPSNFESFGLPLIEARQAGLAVLAPELDYVRDVLNPEQTFDPESAVSIARAVKRFMGIEEQPLPLLDATEFIAYVMNKVK